MADVDINNEAKNLASSNEIGTEIRSAPGGDKAVSVNEQGNFSNLFLIQLFIWVSDR